MSHPEIRASDISPSGQGRSRAVSSDEFQALAEHGRRQYEHRQRRTGGTAGLDAHWEEVVEHAHKAVQEPWGGATYEAATGRPLESQASAYALTSRSHDHPGIAVPPGASKAEFGGAMSRAREEYAPQLNMHGGHLGVFHDADKGTVDIDPVLVVKKRKDVDSLGAYTHATGGAYHFKTGQGHWPPHVED